MATSQNCNSTLNETQDSHIEDEKKQCYICYSMVDHVTYTSGCTTCNRNKKHDLKICDDCFFRI